MGLEIELGMRLETELDRGTGLFWSRTRLGWSFVRSGWGPVCHGFPLTSQHCEAEAALVTARGLFIGVEGIPEHFATSLFPRFLGLGSPGDASGCSGDPLRNPGLCFVFC